MIVLSALQRLRKKDYKFEPSLDENLQGNHD
jgi:hypothetical protein